MISVLDSQPGILDSKPLGGSKVDLTFHPPEVDQMSTSVNISYYIHFLLLFKAG